MSDHNNAFLVLRDAMAQRGMTLHDDGKVAIDREGGMVRSVVSNAHFESGLLKYDMLANMDHYLQTEDGMVVGIYMDDAMKVYAPVTPVPLEGT